MFFAPMNDDRSCFSFNPNFIHCIIVIKYESVENIAILKKSKTPTGKFCH